MWEVMPLDVEKKKKVKKVENNFPNSPVHNTPQFFHVVLKNGSSEANSDITF